MNVLLVHPPINPSVVGAGIFYMGEPLALETIAAPIDNHVVKILDMRSEDSLEKELKRSEPDIVGVTALTVDVYSALDVLSRVKKFDSDILTVVGGHHATVMPDDFCTDAVDVIVIGEGIRTFAELVDAHATGKDLATIPGLALRRNGSLEFSEQRPPIADLDDLPIPARHLTKKYRNSYFRGTWRPYASMITSRGCPYRCKFCAAWRAENGKYRTRSPLKVVEEIESIEEDLVSIADDNFLHDLDRAETICGLIKSRGIRKRYKLIGRSDAIVRRPDLIEQWKEAGLDIMFVGFESFKDKDLKRFGKRTTAAQNSEAIQILRSFGITISAHFIVHQDYDKGDFEALADYVKKMKLRQPVFCILTPLPGTVLYEETKNDIFSTDYGDYDLTHTVLPTKLPIEEFYECYADLYRKSYIECDKDSFVDNNIMSNVINKFIQARQSAFSSV